MKKNFLITILFVFVCFSNAIAEETSKSEEGKTVYLTTEDFLKKVANYKENPDIWVYLGDKPCLVDFYTTWCGPCKRIAPILEDLARQYAGQIYIYKVDTDKERELAQTFGIKSIPTLLFCPMEEVPQMAKGALSKEAFIKIIDEILLKK